MFYSNLIGSFVAGCAGASVAAPSGSGTPPVATVQPQPHLPQPGRPLQAGAGQGATTAGTSAAAAAAAAAASTAQR